MKGSPKPTQLKRLEGNRNKRPLSQELIVQGELPPPPNYLTDEQKARWDDIARALPINYLMAADEPTIERAAIAWAMVRDLTRILNRSGDNGYLVKGAKGNAVISPLVRARTHASRDLAQACMELGLSPLARSRIGNPENVEDDPFEILMGPDGSAWSDYAQQ